MNDCSLMVLTSGEKLALRGVEVSARVAGLLAATTLTQQYRNDTDTNPELAYTFPLPVDGSLLSFSVRIGERLYEGKVIPRKAAELTYEEAISEGHSAFRLQEIRPRMYHASLSNVMAGEAVAITFSYAKTLLWSDPSIRYRLPTKNGGSPRAALKNHSLALLPCSVCKQNSASRQAHLASYYPLHTPAITTTRRCAMLDTIMTHHAVRRLQQRGIAEDVLPLLIKFGSHEHDKRGSKVMYLNSKGRERIRRTLGPEAFSRIEPALDIYAVINTEGAVVTVGHRTQRINRN